MQINNSIKTNIENIISNLKKSLKQNGKTTFFFKTVKNSEKYNRESVFVKNLEKILKKDTQKLEFEIRLQTVLESIQCYFTKNKNTENEQLKETIDKEIRNINNKLNNVVLNQNQVKQSLKIQSTEPLTDDKSKFDQINKNLNSLKDMLEESSTQQESLKEIRENIYNDIVALNKYFDGLKYNSKNIPNLEGLGAQLSQNLYEIKSDLDKLKLQTTGNSIFMKGLNLFRFRDNEKVEWKNILYKNIKQTYKLIIEILKNADNNYKLNINQINEINAKIESYDMSLSFILKKEDIALYKVGNAKISDDLPKNCFDYDDINKISKSLNSVQNLIPKTIVARIIDKNIDISESNKVNNILGSLYDAFSDINETIFGSKFENLNSVVRNQYHQELDVNINIYNSDKSTTEKERSELSASNAKIKKSVWYYYKRLSISVKNIQKYDVTEDQKFLQSAFSALKNLKKLITEYLDNGDTHKATSIKKELECVHTDIAKQISITTLSKENTTNKDFMFAKANKDLQKYNNYMKALIDSQNCATSLLDIFDPLIPKTKDCQNISDEIISLAKSELNNRDYCLEIEQNKSKMNKSSNDELGTTIHTTYNKFLEKRKTLSDKFKSISFKSNEQNDILDILGNFYNLNENNLDMLNHIYKDESKKEEHTNSQFDDNFKSLLEKVGDNVSLLETQLTIFLKDRDTGVFKKGIQYFLGGQGQKYDPDLTKRTLNNLLDNLNAIETLNYTDGKNNSKSINIDMKLKLIDFAKEDSKYLEKYIFYLGNDVLYIDIMNIGVILNVQKTELKCDKNIEIFNNQQKHFDVQNDSKINQEYVQLTKQRLALLTELRGLMSATSKHFNNIYDIFETFQKLFNANNSILDFVKNNIRKIEKGYVTVKNNDEDDDDDDDEFEEAFNNEQIEKYFQEEKEKKEKKEEVLSKFIQKIEQIHEDYRIMPKNIENLRGEVDHISSIYTHDDFDNFEKYTNLIQSIKNNLKRFNDIDIIPEKSQHEYIVNLTLDIMNSTSDILKNDSMLLYNCLVNFENKYIDNQITKDLEHINQDFTLKSPNLQTAEEQLTENYFKKIKNIIFKNLEYVYNNVLGTEGQVIYKHIENIKEQISLMANDLKNADIIFNDKYQNNLYEKKERIDSNVNSINIVLTQLVNENKINKWFKKQILQSCNLKSYVKCLVDCLEFIKSAKPRTKLNKVQYSKIDKKDKGVFNNKIESEFSEEIIVKTNGDKIKGKVFMSMFLMGDASVTINLPGAAAYDSSKAGYRIIRLIVAIENSPFDIGNSEIGIDDSFHICCVAQVNVNASKKILKKNITNFGIASSLSDFKINVYIAYNSEVLFGALGKKSIIDWVKKRLSISNIENKLKKGKISFVNNEIKYQFIRQLPPDKRLSYSELEKSIDFLRKRTKKNEKLSILLKKIETQLNASVKDKDGLYMRYLDIMNELFKGQISNENISETEQIQKNIVRVIENIIGYSLDESDVKVSTEEQKPKNEFIEGTIISKTPLMVKTNIDKKNKNIQIQETSKLNPGFLYSSIETTSSKLDWAAGKMMYKEDNEGKGKNYKIAKISDLVIMLDSSILGIKKEIKCRLRLYISLLSNIAKCANGIDIRTKTKEGNLEILQQ